MRKQILILILFFVANIIIAQTKSLFIEAESFTSKGGWVVDQQFMDLMGSSYLMAHGLGTPVGDAEKKVSFPDTGNYYVYVRTYNWTSPWHNGEGPGRFRLSVNGKKLETILGSEGNSWMWQPAGSVDVKNINVVLKLHDLTGFNGRCDALYFTKDKNDIPPHSGYRLHQFRRKALPPNNKPGVAGTYDFVVIGGGIAGICAAASAARLGCKVALINDRPVLGGNNSSEIRVHLGGYIEIGPYKELGNMIKEFGPSEGGNARSAQYYEDEKKQQFIDNEKNIRLFANYRAIAVTMKGACIETVICKHIETGEELSFHAPVFSDCTGDGTIGALAGAHYLMGREACSDFHEVAAPKVADKITMGASVQWYSVENKKKTEFPVFEYGIDFNDSNFEDVTMGEWTWETGMNLNQITEFEQIRDYGMLVVYSNWSYLKNKYRKSDTYQKRSLGWVAYIAGKRESRRLLGDYILKESDIMKHIVHEDATATTSWTIDLHYPDPANTNNFPGKEFKSICTHDPIKAYPVPYRCLYSRNVDNLFMAGRNISVTHIALGTIRVMRTTGMLGEVVGMAAYLCKKHQVLPRAIYQQHFDEMKQLMKEGTGRKGLPNNQQYNQGAPHLKETTGEYDMHNLKTISL